LGLRGIAPLGRASQLCSIGLQDGIGELAGRKLRAPNRETSVSGALQFGRKALRRERDHDALLRKETANGCHGGYQVAVGGNQQCRVEGVGEGILHHLDGYVHIGLFGSSEEIVGQLRFRQLAK
jgi:hypothetical protein